VAAAVLIQHTHCHVSLRCPWVGIAMLSYVMNDMAVSMLDLTLLPTTRWPTSVSDIPHKSDDVYCDVGWVPVMAVVLPHPGSACDGGDVKVHVLEHAGRIGRVSMTRRS